MTTSKIYPGVTMGEGCTVSDYVEVGVPPSGAGEGELETVMGPGATLRSKTVVYAGNRIGKGFQTGHFAMIREKNTIGDNCSVGTGSVVEHHVTMGNGVRIHSQAFVPEYSILEDNCWIGPNVVLTNARFPCSEKVKETLKGPLIRKGAKIGANVTILPGVEIGEGALVGAGSVVTKDVPAGKWVAGNPAKIMGDLADLEYPEEPGVKAYPNQF